MLVSTLIIWSETYSRLRETRGGRGN